LTFLRLVVTWEAVEHAGPGLYDREYLDYLHEVVRRAGEHGLQVVIDPHQDAWSRLSGGDGAPGWTFEATGMDVTRFSATGAALVHAIHGDPLPRMIWPANYIKLASATMFSLFFGGSDFAPVTKADGQPVQEFLQQHYLAAIAQIARRLKGLPHVVGYEAMNEPSSGFIEWPDLATHHGLIRFGDSPTPFQAMLLGAGFPQEVEVWQAGLTGLRKVGRRLLNPEGLRVWRDDINCPWRENGVWDLDGEGRPRLLRPDHFHRVAGRPVHFVHDYLRPFLERFARHIRTADPEAVIFLTNFPWRAPLTWDPEEIPQTVHAPHWYDALTLYTKRYTPFLGLNLGTGKLVFGRRRVRRSFVTQLAHFRAEAQEHLGGIPTLIGEFGIPFDMQDGRAFRTGDFTRQVQALDDTFQALDANLLSGTLWNYTPDNDNRRGDQWNGEDLSIFSRDQQADPQDPNSGGRALEAAVRPYARRVAGQPLEMDFDLKRRIFTFSFEHDPAVRAPTEIYVPNVHYSGGCRVEVSDGEYQVDRETQSLLYYHSADRQIHRVQLRPE
jgi:hypothetical protein